MRHDPVAIGPSVPAAPGAGLLDRHPWALVVMICAVLLAAVAIRAYKVDAPGMLMDREFNSAIVARDLYFARSDNVEQWRKDLAHATRQNQPGLEIPVTEWLVSLAYSVTGQESFRYARALTAFFWLAGGWFMFRIGRALGSTDAAVFSLGYYLLLPMSILLSRSFQPDSLMMLMYLASLYAIVRYHTEPSRRLLWISIALAGATVLYRPIVMAALAGAFVVPNMQRRGFWRGAFSASSLTFLAAFMAPAILHYGYETLVSGRFGNQVSISFQPYRFLHADYWRGWFDLAISTIGISGAIAAAVGYVMLPAGLPRSIVTGMGLGYLAFGLAFTMHIQTHDYYQAQLIPLVAIAAAPVFVALIRGFSTAPGTWLRFLAGAVLIGIVAVPWWRGINEGLLRAQLEPPRVAQEVGRLVQNSERVVFISRYYGIPLQYQGEFTGTFWPRPHTDPMRHGGRTQELSLQDRWNALGFEPQYFVITNVAEFERHHQDLAAYLDANCRLLARAATHIVYADCRPPGPSS